MKTTTLIILATLCSISGLPASGIGPEIIDKPGKYSLDDNGSTLTISANEDGEWPMVIEWKFTSRRGNQASSSVAPQDALIGEDWFVFVETPSRIWVFDGVRSGTMYKNSRFRLSSEVWNARIMVDVPDAVLDSLPGEVREYWTAAVVDSLSSDHREAP